MDFLRLNSRDLEELNVDNLMRDIKTLFVNREESLLSNFNLGEERLMAIDFRSVRRGDVYLSQYKTSVKKDLVVQNNTGIQNVGLYFRKNGTTSYLVDKKGNIEKSFPANTNGLFFMQEDSSSREFTKEDSCRESISIHFSFEYFKQLVNLYPDLFEETFLRYEKGETFYLKKRFETTTPQQYHILSQIEDAHIFGSGQKAYVDAKVLELLCFQFQTQQDEVHQFSCKTAKDYDKIHEACSVLLTNIHTPPSLRALALEVGINEKKLKCGFKEVYNNTVYGYLFDYKMQLAEQLLQDTSKSIAEVALQCGYEYPSHFCTAFKRRFGISPRQKRSSR